MAQRSRLLAWNVASAIGFSFILTIVMAIVSLVVKAFYPPTVFEVAPLMSLVKSPASGVVQLIVLGLLISFSLPVGSKVAEGNLRLARKVAIYTGVSYLAFSLLPNAFVSPYPQSYVGLVIAYNVLNGAFSGTLATFL